MIIETKIMEIENHIDERGSLCVIEGNNFVFNIERVFYTFNVKKDDIRGQHANRDTEFFLISVSGSCKIRVIDVNNNIKDFTLDEPTKGLYIPKMIWKEMYDFSDDCVLLSLCNSPYNSEEYINNLETFLEVAK